MKTKILVLSSLLAANLALANTIADWTFEVNTPADLNNSTTITGIAADIGAGTASGAHSSAATDWSTPAGNGSANSLSVNTWGVGDYFLFQVSTLGLQGISVGWDQTSSSTGPRDFALKYSTDGTTFTLFTSYSVLSNATPNPVWNAATSSPIYSYLYDLSSITGINNMTSVYFQLIDTSTVSAVGGEVAAAGTGRVDNFLVAGNLIPVGVPDTGTTAFLLGIPLLGLFAFRRFANRPI